MERAADLRLFELRDEGREAHEGKDVEITGLTSDSREVRPGFLFAALDGSRVRGADFIPEALLNGAAAILAPPGTGLGDAAPDAAILIADETPRRRFAEMAARFFARQPNTVAAVTGTNGKSSTVTFIRELWRAGGLKAASLGSLGVEGDGPTSAAALTTLDPVALHRTLAALAAHYDNAPTAPEIILVDDGSDDDTFQLMESWRGPRGDSHAVSIPHAGKAHAVRAGVERAGRDRVLFMDADLAVPLTEVPLLTTALDAGADIAIGSREIPGARRDAESLIRHSRGRLFNWLVSLFAVRGIKDTQCGFKAFATPVARHLFASSRLHHQPPARLNGPSVTAFDVELLFLASRLGYSIAEVPVQWRHVPGSKVDSLRDPLRMTLEVLRIRLNALIGRYP